MSRDFELYDLRVTVVSIEGRSVCGMQTRGYWQTFSSIAYRLKDESPLPSLKAALHHQRDSYRFPTDREFEDELARRDSYSMRRHTLLANIPYFTTMSAALAVVQALEAERDATDDGVCSLQEWHAQAK